MKINEKNLCVFATTPPYDKEGFLSKRGEINKAFQRRYFVLKGNLLFYFEKRGDKDPLGLIIVEGCTIELSEEVDNYCFEIAFNGNRSYVLAAESQESMELWMKALTCAGYEYKRIMVAEMQRQLEEIDDLRNKIHVDNCATMLQAKGIPKPPPRRQNPFNRPAPPPPNKSEMPFINGYFASNSLRQLEISGTDLKENGNECTNDTPKASLRTGTGRNEFFDGQASGAHTVLPHSNHNKDTAALQKQRREKAVEEFKRCHERFGLDVMRDINDYRARKQPPLVEL